MIMEYILEHRSVEQRADGAVGALPHLAEVIFVHARGIGCDGGTLYGNTKALGRLGGIDRHLVACALALREAKVIVLGLEVHERLDELVLNELPDDAGHLVAVHLDQRRPHLDLCHNTSRRRGWVRPIVA